MKNPTCELQENWEGLFVVRFEPPHGAYYIFNEQRPRSSVLKLVRFVGPLNPTARSNHTRRYTDQRTNLFRRKTDAVLLQRRVSVAAPAEVDWSPGRGQRRPALPRLQEALSLVEAQVKQLSEKASTRTNAGMWTYARTCKAFHVVQG